MSVHEPETRVLRHVAEADLHAFFEHQLDPAANVMAAFTGKDPADQGAFLVRWRRMLADPAIVLRTISAGGAPAGYVAHFHREGAPEVSYWLGRAHWGKGLATRGLSELLSLVTTRPLYARAAKDNAASLRVLEKCGFMVSGHERAFANARGAEIDEVVLTLAPR